VRLCEALLKERSQISGTRSLLGHPSELYVSLQLCANLHCGCEQTHASHGVCKWEATLIIQEHSENEL